MALAMLKIRISWLSDLFPIVRPRRGKKNVENWAEWVRCAHGNAHGFVLHGWFDAISWADAADSVAVFTDFSEGWTPPI